MITEIAIFSLLFLVGASILSGTSTCLSRLGRLQAEEELKENCPQFFFKTLAQFLFGKQKWDGLLFSLSFTKHLLRMGFVFTAFFFFLEHPLFQNAIVQGPNKEFLYNGPLLFSMMLLILAISLAADFLTNLAGQLRPQSAFRVLGPLASLLLLICIPITAPFFHIWKLFIPKHGKDKKLSPTFRMREKVQDLLQETELGVYLDTSQQKFILSVVSFRERIAREVMVPRINVFSLDSDTPLEEAARRFLTEGYSRIPVYKDSVDNIIGVLLYKDVLKVYVDQKQAMQKVEKLVKPVLYTPETKKISQLLQEFRNKQIHLAIVVDEWGGTEGIVTIEDVLEELVGEISDEYDTGQERLYTTLPDGGWIVDSKMSIIDILEDLEIEIPQGPEYDTIGGYIFHRAGTIPSKGWRIHHDDFDLEVLSSSERAVEKIRITPHQAD